MALPLYFFTRTRTSFHRTITIFFSTSSISATQINKESTTTAFSDLLLTHCGFSPSDLKLPNRKLRALADNNSIQTLRRALQYLHDFGFENDDIYKIVKRCPRFIGHDLDSTLAPRLELFKAWGMPLRQLVLAVTKDPRFIIHRPLTPSCRIEEDLRALEGIYGDRGKLIQAVQNYPLLVHMGLDSHVRPTLVLLRNSGIPWDNILHLITRKPSILNVKPENLGVKLACARKLGIPSCSKQFVLALVAMTHSKVEQVQEKFKTLRGLGFKEDEVAYMIFRFPLLISVSCGKLKRTVEFLLQFVGFDVMVKNPFIFNNSFDRNVRPRLKVAMFLKNADPLFRLPSVLSVVSMNEKAFLQKYVHGREQESVLMEVFTETKSQSLKETKSQSLKSQSAKEIKPQSLKETKTHSLKSRNPKEKRSQCPKDNKLGRNVGSC